MKKIEIQAAKDHVLAQTKLKKPIIAIEELIWNALDADANHIEVTLVYTKLGALAQIKVKDDGHGIDHESCEKSFGFLGGSQKRQMEFTPGGRRPHGKLGRGRLKAFGLGRNVVWRSYFVDASGGCQKFDICGNRSNIRNFEIGEITTLKTPKHGVEVEISGLEKNFHSLSNSESSAKELSRRLALYLYKYPSIVIKYDGIVLDPKDMEDHVEHYDLEIERADGGSVSTEITVIEWKYPVDRMLYLCDPHGLTKDERPPGIQAPGFQFTAYVKSAVVDELEGTAAFALDELHPDLKAVLDASKDTLREHFRKREKSRRSDLVEQWKKEKVYPYQKESADPLQTAEREVFDVCAIKVHEYLPSFEESDSKNKQLTFRLIKEALESNPSTLQTILREVLALPQEQQDDFAKILEKTSLASIIHAANTIVDRLTFLQSLEPLLFGGMKKTLKERSQLQKILVNELWIFGEQYDLGCDDESLKNVLAKHVEQLDRTDLNPAEETVTDIDGKQAIVDLMLYSRLPHKTPNSFEHLIIELKRPSCKIGKKEISQIENYGISVAGDERFQGAKVKWKFLLIGNDLSDFAKEKCEVNDREYGHIIAKKKVDVYVTTWSTIIEAAKWRYNFLHEQLKLKLGEDASLAYLHEKYGDILAKKKSSKQASTTGKPKPKGRKKKMASTST